MIHQATPQLGSIPAQPSAVTRVLGDLFPVPPEAPSRKPGRRLLSVVAQVAAVGLGAVLLLYRIPGQPTWNYLKSDDYPIFLVQALQRPWDLYIPYGGYEQLAPRVVGQLVTYLPLADAAPAFAVFGALVTAGCGLLVFHASAGHVRSVTLRALLGATVVLLPSAALEIADSNVGAPWYMLLALFWVVLWRPRTRAGMALAAFLAFATAASTILVVFFAPLLAARLFVLRRVREHAVTVGWLAGCLAQVPAVIWSSLHHQSRLATHGTLGNALPFYAHDVLLPSLGLHLAWWLQSFAGRNGATAIVAAVLALIVGAILLTQPGSRSFVVAAVGIGFIVSVFCATVNANTALPVTPRVEPGARYTGLPIFLIEAVVIVGADRALRDRVRIRLRPALAVAALVALFAATWVADFRYPGTPVVVNRPWAQIAARWLAECEHSQSGEITVRPVYRFDQIPCDRLRALAAGMPSCRAVLTGLQW